MGDIFWYHISNPKTETTPQFVQFPQSIEIDLFSELFGVK